LHWHLAHPNAEARRKALEEKNWRVPEHLYPPDLPIGTEQWWNDFHELSTDRQMSMSVGPIPAASIDRHIAGWSDDDAGMFRAVIRAMDRVYLQHSRSDPDAPESDNPTRDAFRATMGR